MITTTNNKIQFIKALIGEWLKDQTIYCNNCGLPALTLHDRCCENPQIGKNIDHCRAVIKQNDIARRNLRNDLGATDNLTIRRGVSLPPKLSQFLNTIFRDKYNEKLFNDNKEFYAFMRSFPQFRIPKRV